MKGDEIVYDIVVANGKKLDALIIESTRTSSTVRHHNKIIHGTEQEKGLVAKVDDQSTQCKICHNNKKNWKEWLKWLVPTALAAAAFFTKK